MSKVSIIVPFYNCSYIDQALKSLVNQTYENIEIIVVNDGSTQHVEKLNPFLGKIKYIEKENGGTASALNTGIKNATGDYFCWLSSDDIFYPEKTNIQLAFMKEKNASFSYSNYLAMNENSKIISSPQGVKLSGRLEQIQVLQKGCVINGCSVMINMDVFNHTGVFDESLPFTHDYDLWLRILPKYDFHYLDQALLMYRVHDQMGTKKHARAIEKETRYVVIKHRPVMNKLLIEQLNKLKRSHLQN